MKRDEQVGTIDHFHDLIWTRSQLRPRLEYLIFMEQVEEVNIT